MCALFPTFTLLVFQNVLKGNSNPDLNVYVQPNTVLEWIRNTVANRMAASAEEWYQIYAPLNSGTYNNQNYILDFKRFKPHQPVQPGTLTMVEQIPNYVKLTDVSDLLQQKGYWGSCQLWNERNTLRNVPPVDFLPPFLPLHPSPRQRGLRPLHPQHVGR